MEKRNNEKRKATLVLSMVLLLGAVIAVIQIAPALASTMVCAVIPGALSECNVSPNALHFPQNKQNEAPMAVNPRDPNNAITGANDLILQPDCTPAAGGTSNCAFQPNTDVTGVYWTKDGGATWNTQILRWSSSPLGIASDGDPVVAFGPKPDASGKFSWGNGVRAYFGSLAGCRCNTQELIAVSYSDDGGETWSDPVLATTRDNPVDFNDKIALWVDANENSPNFGNLYVSWTLFIGRSKAITPEPILISRSTDGGNNFEKPVQLTQASNNGVVGGRQGSVIRTGSDGAVYVFWDGSLFRKSAILGARSDDGGSHFGRPFLVSYKSDVPSPFPGASFRVNSFPMADVSQGRIFVVWADYSAGHSTVKMITSSDRGETWNAAQTVANVIGRSAFFPSIALKPDGSKVFVGFNAIDDVPAGTPPGAGVVSYDAYYAISEDAGASFAPPVKISAAPSDPDVSSANSLDGQFIGDYNGASASDTAAWFSWTDSRNGDTCSAVDDFRAGTAAKPNIYDSCSPDFGNTDIFAAAVPW